FAVPDLLAADEHQAAGNAKPVLAVHLHLGPVAAAVGRVKDGAAGPIVILWSEPPENLHALDGLVLALARALVADRVRPAVGLEDFHHRALQRAVRCPADLDDGLGLAGFVVDRLPAAFGAGLGRDGEGEEREQCRGVSDGAHGFSLAMPVGADVHCACYTAPGPPCNSLRRQGKKRTPLASGVPCPSSALRSVSWRRSRNASPGSRPARTHSIPSCCTERRCCSDTRRQAAACR